MIETLISSKTRIKLLLKFFLNRTNKAYLRNLEEEFNESTNGIRIELNRLEEAGMILSENIGNKKVFTANTKHPLFKDINSIVMKHFGIDQIIEEIILKLGNINEVYLVGNFARGIDGEFIDLVFVGDVNKNYLQKLTSKIELQIKRKINYEIIEFYNFDLTKLSITNAEPLLLWSK